MMAFRLCLAIGCLHPDYLLGQLTARQWVDWLAFSSVESWGDSRADLRSAIAAAHLSNRWRGKNERPIEVVDLMPFEDKPQVSQEQLDRKISEAIYAASCQAKH